MQRTLKVLAIIVLILGLFSLCLGIYGVVQIKEAYGWVTEDVYFMTGFGFVYFISSIFSFIVFLWMSNVNKHLSAIEKEEVNSRELLHDNNENISNLITQLSESVKETNSILNSIKESISKKEERNSVTAEKTETKNFDFIQ